MRINTKLVYSFLLITLLECTSVVFSDFPADNALTGVILVPDQYPTIQSAIDAAYEGSLILVKPGRYTECIVIDKPLRLMGSGVNLSIIENAGWGHTVEIKADGVVLKGFAIRGLKYGSWAGIYVRGSNCVIEDNFVEGHSFGIKIYDSSNNILRNNFMFNNTYNFGVWGLFLSHFIHDVDFSNVADGKPILYWVNKQNQTVPLGVSCVILVNSSRIMVRDFNISKNLSGITLAYTKDSLIMNVTVSNNERGLYFLCSNNNIVVQNDFSDNYWSGITIISSCNNIFVGNNIVRNKNGVRLSHSVNILGVLSENNTIIGNILSDNQDGLYFEKSNNNVIKGNIVINNTRSGLVLDDSCGNIIKGNFVKNNKYGVWSLASQDLIYQNIFANNSFQVYIYPYSTTLTSWDGGYPSGGNYWSDYKGLDEKHGPDQDQSGSDGIGDFPYIINLNNRDRYPLLHPCVKNSLPIPNFSQTPFDARVEENVLFVDESSDVDGQIMLRIWKIDGEYFWPSKNISIQFKKEKTYNVTLIVFDDYGASDKKSKAVFVRRFIPTLLIFVHDSINLGDKLEISATLLDENGNPVVGSLISFYLIDNIEEFIGSATTNFDGTAKISYITAKAGVFHLRAIFLGDQKYESVCIEKKLIVKSMSNYYTFWIFCLLVAISVITLFKIKTCYRNRRRRIK